jgi:hypothetical protein
MQAVAAAGWGRQLADEASARPSRQHWRAVAAPEVNVRTAPWRFGKAKARQAAARRPAAASEKAIIGTERVTQTSTERDSSLVLVGLLG